MLTLNEVAAQLRCSRRTVNRLVARGTLKVFRLRNTVRVKQENLDKLIQRWTD